MALDATTEGERGRSGRRSWTDLGSGGETARTAVLLLPVAGVACIGWSYELSSAGGGTGFFHVFWLGMLLGYLPLGGLALAARATRHERRLALAALALFTVAPKYLRNAGGPLYFDERAHWLQVQQVLADGHLFQRNDAVPIVRYYPGLHAVTAAMVQTTGLSTWHAAEVLVAVAHVVGALGVFALAGSMLQDRQAALAAVVYMANAEWVYFDGQFAYESLGVPLFVWSLYFAARLRDARGARWRWAGVLALTAAVTVLTHHVTAAWLAGYLLVGLAHLLVQVARRRRSLEQPTAVTLAWFAGATVFVSGAAGVYVLLVAPRTSDYLGGILGTGLSQFLHLTGGGGGSRQLFAGSPSPAYERYLAFGAPVLVGALLTWHALRAWGSSGAGRGLLRPVSLIAWLYVLSVPLVLVPAGSEAARRSWAFSYVGVAVVLADTLLPADRRERRRITVSRRATAGPTTPSVRRRVGPGAPGAQPRWRLLRRPGTGLLLAPVLAVLVVGNLAAGENVPYRFPGPYLYGSDTRSVTVGMEAAARWWSTVRPPGSGVVTDRYDAGLYQAVLGTRVATSAEGPVWDFWFSSGTVSPYLVQALERHGFDYLVIDKNVTRFRPLLGTTFDGEEPAEDQPARERDVERWLGSPYTTRVFDSDQIVIYRLDASAPQAVDGQGVAR